MFGWREVYITISISDLEKARETLEQNGVRYHWKSGETSSSLFGRDNMRNGGSIGLDLNAAKQYRLFVKKQNFEQAQYLIGNLLRR